MRADDTHRQSNEICSKRWSAIHKVIVVGEDVELASSAIPVGPSGAVADLTATHTPICEATLTGWP